MKKYTEIYFPEIISVIIYDYLDHPLEYMNAEFHQRIQIGKYLHEYRILRINCALTEVMIRRQREQNYLNRSFPSLPNLTVQYDPDEIWFYPNLRLNNDNGTPWLLSRN